MRRRTAPPKPPPGPPRNDKEGAAAVIRAATKLFDRQDGVGGWTSGCSPRSCSLRPSTCSTGSRMTNRGRSSPGVSMRARMAGWSAMRKAVLWPGTRGQVVTMNRRQVLVRLRPDPARRDRDNRLVRHFAAFRSRCHFTRSKLALVTSGWKNSSTSHISSLNFCRPFVVNTLCLPL